MEQISYDLQLIRKELTGDKIYSCPCCNEEITVYSGTFYGKCPSCSVTIIDYVPAPHQEAFHKSFSKYRLNLGGYGSGKTTMCCAEVNVHTLSTPSGHTLICGPKLQQIREAVIPVLDSFIPPWFIKRKVSSPNIEYVLTNDHKISVFASDDQEKLRSLSLTAFYIEEASGVDYSVFEQLQARLRNEAAAIRDSMGNVLDYNFMGLICSNPEDNGWFMDKFILMSDRIYASESIPLDNYKKIKSRKPEKLFHTFLSSSRDNKTLPKNYVSELCVGKTPQWISKYIDCNLELRDGVVYPEYTKCIVEPFDIPDYWLRIYGYDKGYRDETALPCGAIDPKTGVIYIYDDYYVSQQPMSFHAIEVKKRVNPFKSYKPVQADPSIRNKNERDGITYKHYFYKLSGIMLEEANNDIEFGIEKVRNYMYLGKLKFFSTCVNITFEMLKYSYPDVEKRKNNQKDPNKPIDRFNHLCDAIRYMIVGLPEDPNELISIYSSFVDVLRTKAPRNLMELDKEDYESDDGDIYSMPKIFTSGRY